MATEWAWAMNCELIDEPNKITNNNKRRKTQKQSIEIIPTSLNNLKLITQQTKTKIQGRKSNSIDSTLVWHQSIRRGGWNSFGETELDEFPPRVFPMSIFSEVHRCRYADLKTCANSTNVARQHWKAIIKKSPDGAVDEFVCVKSPFQHSEILNIMHT